MIKSVMVDGAEALKLMVDGKVAWERGGLPAGYQRCKYLESTGVQYIDTGVIVKPLTDESRIDYMSLKTDGESFQVPFGVSNESGARGWHIYIGSAGYLNFRNGIDTAVDTGIHIGYGERFSCILCGSGFSVGSATFKRASDNNVVSYPITIGKRNTGDRGSSAYAKGRFFSFSHYRSGEILMNLFPCLDPSGIPCMYDTVSKQPFYNQGTGEFLYELA